MGATNRPKTTIIVGEANGWIRALPRRMPIILDWRDVGVDDGRAPRRVVASATD